MTDNKLYYGDNLDILDIYIKDESVDLVYLDPPFNSNKDYNVLFREHSGSKSAAQIKAFTDTWSWDDGAEESYRRVVEADGKLSETMRAFRLILGTNDLMAYLAMMASRLKELHRVLKPTGSIYLHCDPTASHYIKLLMDAVFGPKRFRTEIIWKRSSAHSDTKQGRKQHGRLHDTILFYTKGDEWTWNPQYTPYSKEYIESNYRHVDPGSKRRFKSTDLTAAKPGGDTSYEWKGRKPPAGRYWAYSKENVQRFEDAGLLYYTSTGLPRLKQYLDEMPGVSLQDLWTDIPPLAAQAAERLGYPTQKPEALLDRIIKTSSNEGDIILDPFCGCGTAVVSAQRLNRKWIGIDITHLATNLIKSRLQDAFGDSAKYTVKGEPTTLSEAEALAEQDKYEFQNWALGLVKARKGDVKKGADGGIDGKLLFHDDATGRTKLILISVKGGSITLSMVRDLAWVLERERAAIGVFITLKEPTKPMRKEAASAGTYFSPGWNKTYPKLQILTVKELLDGKGIDYPPSNVTFKTAPKVTRERAETLVLPFDDRSVAYN